MQITVVGLPNSGKTTVFNALTRGKAEVTSYSRSLAPNSGVAKVMDPRLAELERIYQPRKVVPADVHYVDIGGSLKSFGREGTAGEFLNYLSTADALLQVVRAFEDDNLPHPQGSLDPKRDIADLDLELAFPDLAVIERRLPKLEAALKAAKAADREALLKERAVLDKVREGLEKDIPVRQQAHAHDDLRILSGYQFLTAKPMMVLLNIGEDGLAQASQLENEIASAYPQFAVVALCGTLEMELGQLSDAEAKEFRETMDLATPALDRVIALSYHLLGTVSFFTASSSELRAWPLPQGTPASKAAGKIHSDMEKGFIRAEVIGFDDLVRSGSVAEARQKGLVRMEGRDSVIQDGDIVTFLFNN